MFGSSNNREHSLQTIKNPFSLTVRKCQFELLQIRRASERVPRPGRGLRGRRVGSAVADLPDHGVGRRGVRGLEERARWDALQVADRARVGEGRQGSRWEALQLGQRVRRLLLQSS